MEELFYKVRLVTGRVIGPIDLNRVHLFIYKGKITGLEQARLYPTGEWRDINTYSEIANLLMQKLEGKLQAPANAGHEEQINENANPADADNSDKIGANDIAIPQTPPDSPTAGKFQKSLSISVGSIPLTPPSGTLKQHSEADDERTMMITADEERTMMVKAPDPETPAEQPKVEFENEVPAEEPIDLGLASEKTAMLQRPPKEPPKTGIAKLAGNKKIFVAIALVIAAIFAVLPEDKKAEEIEPAFKVVIPATAQTTDPQEGLKLFNKALEFYNHDTVDGYKKAAKIFLDSLALDPNNVRALCLLTSSYLNLIDVVNRDENYFNVVTRLIEMARAKGVDIAEMVIADVELYHVLGNPDAAINRIVEFSKSHDWGIELLYYLGLSFYLKGDHSSAFAQLNKLDPKNYFSPKIPYLLGLLYKKNNQIDEALKHLQETVSRSSKHIKARVQLAELYYRKDNLPESGKHADFVILNKNLASSDELAKAYFYRARMHMVASRDQEALADLEVALKRDPDDQDILLEYYTLKAKLGGKVKDAQGKAKMFYHLAQGEKALKENNLDAAMAEFMSARQAQDEHESAPLLKIAEVFRRKGDLRAALINYAKAQKSEPKRQEIYPKYIKALTDGYEFEDAAKMLGLYKELNPPAVIVDKLQGDLFFKQEKLIEAFTFYKRALAASNADSSIYIAFANLMFKTNNFRDSAFYYGLSQRFDPYNVEATVGIGKSLSELESLDKGIEHMQTALQSSPHKAALLNGIAEIYVRKGDYTSALKFVENALTTDQNFAQPYKTKGDALAAQEKHKEALDAYLTYTNLAPLDPMGHVERYRLFMRKLDLKSAKSEIQSVIADYPKFPGAYYMLGELYREGQNYTSALEAADIEIKNNPTFLPAYALAGQAYNMNKEYAKALELLNRALRMNPNFPPALIQAGIANHMLKTYAAAQTMLERALQLDQGNPEIHKRLGVLYFDMGHRDKAKVRFKSYIDLYPNAPDRADIEKLAQ